MTRFGSNISLENNKILFENSTISNLLKKDELFNNEHFEVEMD